MESRNGTKLRVGDWIVDAETGELSKQGLTQRLDMRSTRLLMSLAKRPGQLVASTSC
jgi:DNA-binding winged helix-turn-helix (wHTH) protein